MIHSMTGFAHKICAIDSRSSNSQANISLSVKSLNSRFLETTIKIPSLLSHLETTIIKLCKEKLHRGHIYITGYISNSAPFESATSASLSVVDGYMAAITDIKKRYNITDEVTLDNLLQLPNIFVKEEQILDDNATHIILATITELIDNVIAERRTEGIQLTTDLENRIVIIKQEMKIITENALVFIEEQKQKVHATLQEIGAEENLLVNAQKNSFYHFLDKIDIHEEIVRFSSHLELLVTCLHSSGNEKGKRIDFTLQELGREINTIAAKCSDPIISSHAINIKVEIEKMREQIQNIV